MADATEPEKWIGPILTSGLSLVATWIAFLSGRDKMKFDANTQITANRLKELENESTECKKESKLLRRRLSRVIANLQAQMMSRPLPFPKELGFVTEEDDPAPPTTS